MSVLLLAEHDNQTLKAATLNALSAAKQLGDVTVLVVGFACEHVSRSAAKLPGVVKVLQADASHYAEGLPEDLGALLASIAADYRYFLAPATTFGKNIMPRVAALIDAACISDIIKVESENTFVRPTYAGNALATVQVDAAKIVITVRTSAFDASAVKGGSATIETLAALESSGLSAFVGRELTKSERPDIISADIVISGGRGLGSAENFKLIETIADKLGAAVGASRAAVDAGFVPNDYQVGQTGKIIAPKLYIAVGISGAIQHLAGMKDSKVIVAINKDEEAPIFSVATYGLVADLFQALPELSNELDKFT